MTEDVAPRLDQIMPPAPAVCIAVEPLTDLVGAVLMAMGLPAAAAEATATVLVDAEMRGIAGHGIWRVHQYHRVIAAGRLNVSAQPTLLRDDGPTAVLDAGYGLGYEAALRATTLGVDKAREHGMATIAVRNSGHFGAAGYYALRGAAAGMLTMVLTNTTPWLHPPGGAGRVLGNNPLAVAAPSSSGPPFLLDLAFSGASVGELRRRSADGRPIPDHWGKDPAGHRTADPAAVLDRGSLEPIGGHKGFGLALVVEILAGVLSGADFAPTTRSIGESAEGGCGHLFVVWDIARLMPLDEFGDRLEQLLTHVAATESSRDGFRRPGLRGHQSAAHSRAHGVTIDAASWAELLTLATRVGVTPPVGLAHGADR